MIYEEGSTKIGPVHKSGKNSTFQTFLTRRNCAYPSLCSYLKQSNISCYDREVVKYNTVCFFYCCPEHCRHCGILFDKAAMLGVSIKERYSIISNLVLFAVKI
jgi:hypothetical protein